MADHVLVVGGTKGLGRVVAERFRSRGFAVTVVSRHEPARSDAEPGFNHIAADLERLDSPNEIVSRSLEIAGPIRYMLFCQRYRGDGDPWRGELQVSLTATKVIIEGFADHFCPDGDRAIGIVSSVYAQFVGGSQPVGYHVAKAGLSHVTRYFATTLGRKGVRVNAILPLTYLKRESREFYLGNEPLLDVYRRLVPLGRLGEADDSADLLDFLCSRKAAFINGQCIFVDGGVSVIWPEELARDFSGV